MVTIPTPGSDEALEQMCACAILDNHHGAGVDIKSWHDTDDDCPQSGNLFWVNMDCPLHGKNAHKDGLIENNQARQIYRGKG